MKMPSKNFTITMQKDGPIVSNGQGESHHHMVSETRNTFEVRTFKTPEKWEQIIAAIEICRNLAHFAKEYTSEGYNLQQILTSKDSPFLNEYMKEQKLNFSETTPLEGSISISRQIKEERNIF